MGTNAQRLLTLPGTIYDMNFDTNLATTNWIFGDRIPLTNLWQIYEVDQQPPQLYFRAKEY